MDEPFRRFRLGSLDCTVLSDGRFDYPATAFFANAQPDELAAAFERHGIRTGRIETPYACLLVDSAGQRVLIDTGGAGWDPTVGHLGESLVLAGIAPASVDTVILTHGHPDHIGGTAGDDGQPIFERARHIMSAADWAYWTTESTFAPLPDGFRRVAEHNLRPIADRVELVDGELEVAPGISLLPAPGHTPGHLAVVLQDGGQELLYVSDAFVHPIQLEHPEWGPKYDVDPAQAAATRRALCERAVRNGSLVHAFHFDPFPCLGAFRADTDTWRWEPVAMETRELLPA